MKNSYFGLSILKTALCLLAIMIGSMQYSAAHTQLTQSIPTANAVLKNPPRTFKLSFAEPVTLLSLKLKDGQSKKIPLKFKANATASPHFNLAAPELKKGRYHIEWKILSQDGHVLTGQYSFRIL